MQALYQVSRCVILEGMSSGTSRPPPGPLSLKVSKILRGRAREENLTQMDLKRATGISQSKISAILTGKESMDVTHLDWLCDALGMSIGSVILEAEEYVRLTRSGTSQGSDSERDRLIERSLDQLGLPGGITPAAG